MSQHSDTPRPAKRRSHEPKSQITPANPHMRRKVVPLEGVLPAMYLDFSALYPSLIRVKDEAAATDDDAEAARRHILAAMHAAMDAAEVNDPMPGMEAFWCAAKNDVAALAASPR